MSKTQPAFLPRWTERSWAEQADALRCSKHYQTLPVHFKYSSKT